MIDKWAGMLWMRFKDIYGQKWLSLFQGDEAIESWRVTWASGLNVTVEQIQYALSRIGTDYPDWPPTFGQFKSLCEAAPRPYISLPVPKREPQPDRIADLRKAAAGIKTPAGPWWTVDRVRNQAQVNYIILQANHFGRMSPAGRFYDQCVDAGIINDCKFVQRMREPGED